jgi:plastocyanin domain-containing protein
MSIRAIVAGLSLGLLISACSKKQEATPPPKAQATVSTGTVGADGVRKVAIDVVKEGYSPDRIPGKPGEQLSLVFTRKVDGACYEELKTPDGKLIALPKDKPVAVPVKVPEDGEVRFACGMDMLSGVVVAEKS